MSGQIKNRSGQDRIIQVTSGQDDVRPCHVISGEVRSGYVRSDQVRE